MKKIILSVALVLCAMAVKAEVVAKDTIAYSGAYKLDKIEKVNEYGEVSVRYVCYLLDVVNKKGEPRKVTTDRKTYESGKINAIVYNYFDEIEECNFDYVELAVDMHQVARGNWRL